MHTLSCGLMICKACALIWVGFCGIINSPINKNLTENVMRLKNILIVVKDIEKSRKFYHDLFGIDLVLDNDGNMILTEGLVLQDVKIWKSFLERDIIPKSNSC